MQAAVKRLKAVQAPPPLCSGCYWQNLTRRLRDENRQLRYDLLKARNEKRKAPASKKHTDIHDPDHEPLRPGHSTALDDADSQMDLVDFLNKGRHHES